MNGLKGKPLDGKAVIVTGSSRGIGRETALMFGLLGAHIVLHGRDTEALARSRAYLAGRGVDAVAYGCDVTDADGCRNLVRTCLDSYGRLDVLVNNAGLSMRGNFADLVPEVVERIVGTNITGAILPTIAALPALRETQGSVVFVSTVAALHGFPRVSIYSAAKMSLTAIAQSLEAELHSDGVHVGVAYLPFVENDEDKLSLSTDGSLISVHRRAQISQSAAAEAIVRLVRRRHRRTVPSGVGRLLVACERIAPRLVQSVLNGSGGRFHRQ